MTDRATIPARLRDLALFLHDFGWHEQAQVAEAAADALTEPPPLSELVTCSLRDPDHVIHRPRLDCQHEAPHLISACGAFALSDPRPPAPDVEGIRQRLEQAAKYDSLYQQALDLVSSLSAQLVQAQQERDEAQKAAAQWREDLAEHIVLVRELEAQLTEAQATIKALREASHG